MYHTLRLKTEGIRCEQLLKHYIFYQQHRTVKHTNVDFSDLSFVATVALCEIKVIDVK